MADDRVASTQSSMVITVQGVKILSNLNPDATEFFPSHLMEQQQQRSITSNIPGKQLSSLNITMGDNTANNNDKNASNTFDTQKANRKEIIQLYTADEVAKLDYISSLGFPTQKSSDKITSQYKLFEDEQIEKNTLTAHTDRQMATDLMKNSAGDIGDPTKKLSQNIVKKPSVTTSKSQQHTDNPNAAEVKPKAKEKKQSPLQKLAQLVTGSRTSLADKDLRTIKSKTNPCINTSTKSASALRKNQPLDLKKTEENRGLSRNSTASRLSVGEGRYRDTKSPPTVTPIRAPIAPPKTVTTPRGASTPTEESTPRATTPRATTPRATTPRTTTTPRTPRGTPIPQVVAPEVLHIMLPPLSDDCNSDCTTDESLMNLKDTISINSSSSTEHPIPVKTSTSQGIEKSATRNTKISTSMPSTCSQKTTNTKVSSGSSHTIVSKSSEKSTTKKPIIPRSTISSILRKTEAKRVRPED